MKHLIGAATIAMAIASIFNETKKMGVLAGIGKVSVDPYNNNIQYNLIVMLKGITSDMTKTRNDALDSLKIKMTKLYGGDYAGIYGVPDKTSVYLYVKTRSILALAYKTILDNKSWGKLGIVNLIDKIVSQKKYAKLKFINDWKAGGRARDKKNDWKSISKRRLRSYK